MADAVKADHGTGSQVRHRKIYDFSRQRHGRAAGTGFKVHLNIQGGFRTAHIHLHKLRMVLVHKTLQISETSCGISAELTAHHLHMLGSVLLFLHKSNLLRLILLLLQKLVGCLRVLTPFQWCHDKNCDIPCRVRYTYLYLHKFLQSSPIQNFSASIIPQNGYCSQ